MAASYSEKQLEEIEKNLSLISLKAIKILEAIEEEPGINHNDIPEKSGMSKFVSDKCISAYIATGLIRRADDGARKFYTVTEDGVNLLKLIREGKGDKK